MDIQLSFAPGTNFDMMVVYEMASRVWEDYLGDDVTVHVYVGTSPQLPTKVAGGALSGIAPYQQYDTFRTQLTADATSTDDTTAVGSLNPGSTYDLAIGNRLSSNSEMKLTRANAKAIGMIAGHDTILDGIILMNDLSAHPRFGWDYDAVDLNVGSHQLDAMSVAIHEIGHILGYVSGVDTLGQQQSALQVLGDSSGTSQVTPLDMFRASRQTVGQSTISMTVGANAYFSIDQGVTNLGNFSQGGNSFQASHWENSRTPLGIMDPTISLGERMTISELDLRAFDVIGWDRQDATTIDLAALELDAKGDLATQLGQTVAWLENNQTTAAESLTVDRSTDVETMVVESQIYNSLWGGGNGNWQEIMEHLQNAMWETENFSSLEEETSKAETLETPTLFPNIPPIDSFIGTPNVSPEDIFDQGVDELLNHGSLQPDQPETKLDLESTGGYSADPFTLLGVSNQPPSPLLGESNFGLDLPGGVATWFEGASLGVEAVFS